ncbi:MAG TPA: imidazoleglycerol-phosphate dehydratase HisB [Rhodothermales bacterium]|jgi:imidazoleglycerol-phosphate dehydratase
MNPRSAEKHRKTKETEVRVRLNLDGTGQYEIDTGIPFFDHMLAQLARHGRMDLEIEARGDLEIDGHHTVEDVGLTLGQAINEALGERRGIARFAHAYVPLDEALGRVVVDFSGRGYLVYRVQLETPMLGDLQTELIEEFFKAVVQEGRMNLHVESLYGRNQHHIAETLFKAAARAIYTASRVVFDDGEIPSTKGSL